MLWIIDEYILKREPRYSDLIRVLERFEQEYILVKKIPFVDKLFPVETDLSSVDDVNDIPEVEIPDDVPVFHLGSVALDKLAQRRGWKPGSMATDNFDFNVWGKKCRWAFNADAQVVKFRDLVLETDMFIRPVNDDKLFTGFVCSPEKVEEWKANLINNNSDKILDEEIVCAVPKKIQKEFRFFVCDDKILTGSQYKLGSRTVYEEVTEGHEAWKEALSFVSPISVDYFRPSDAYVIDLAMSGGKYYLLEYNNINSAGFYHSDMQKIIAGLISLDV